MTMYMVIHGNGFRYFPLPELLARTQVALDRIHKAIWLAGRKCTLPVRSPAFVWAPYVNRSPTKAATVSHQRDRRDRDGGDIRGREARTH
jgi:hypothetical protein